MNRKYNLKLDLQSILTNKTMEFSQFDNDTSDFFMQVTNNGEPIDIEKALVVLVAIKPSGRIESQFLEIEGNSIYCNLKPSMKDETGIYIARAMFILEGKRITTSEISYMVNEDAIMSLLNDEIQEDERFTLLTDILSRLSSIELNENTRISNEVDRLELQDKLETLIREVERAEVIRKENEVNREKLHLEMEDILEESKRINANSTSINKVSNELITSMNLTHENVLKAYDDAVNTTNEIKIIKNEVVENEAERQKFYGNSKITIQQIERSEDERRVNENTRIANETARELKVSNYENRYEKLVNDTTNLKNNFNDFNTQANSNEQTRIQAEQQRKDRYTNFENDYNTIRNQINNRLQETTQAKDALVNEVNQTKESLTNTVNSEINKQVKRVDSKINEVDTIKNQMVSNVSNATNEANRVIGLAEGVIAEMNEAREEIIEDASSSILKIREDANVVISEINETKTTVITNVNNTLTAKINEVNQTKENLTNTVNNKTRDIENRFNRLTAQQQRESELIDSRDGEESLNKRLNRDIGNINQELDSIKKLNETKASTIETNDNFTYVEATNNGYFENIKLEGKTLVNLYENKEKSFNASYIYTNDESLDISKLKPNTKYTLIVLGSDKVVSTSICNNSSSQYFYIKQSGKTTTFTTPNNFDGFTDKIRVYVYSNSINPFIQGDEEKIKCIILEGDHIQKTIGYFEGIKSVGENIEEISVESININIFNENILSKYITKENEDSFALDYFAMHTDDFLYPINGKGQYTLTYSCKETTGGKNPRFLFVYKDGSIENIHSLTTNEFVTYRASSNPNKELLGLQVLYTTSGGNWFIKKDSIMLSKGNKNNTYKSYESDKKQLLYYNDETQRWEKPTLGEWDYIEKHSNGRYYYHKNSVEYVLNDTDVWDKWTFETFPNGYLLRNRSITDANLELGKINVYSDKYKPIYYTNNNDLLDKSIICSAAGNICIVDSRFSDVSDFIRELRSNPIKVVYKTKKEKVYECTNIDLITYENETNYVVSSGAITPKTTLKVHNNISNIVTLLQKKVSVLESNLTDYTIKQNRLMLKSRFNADTVNFKVDATSSFSDSFDYDNDLYELILRVIIVGKDNYDLKYIKKVIDFYWFEFIISDEMCFTLLEIIKNQHNIEEENIVNE